MIDGIMDGSSPQGCHKATDGGNVYENQPPNKPSALFAISTGVTAPGTSQVLDDTSSSEAIPSPPFALPNGGTASTRQVRDGTSSIEAASFSNDPANLIASLRHDAHQKLKQVAPPETEEGTKKSSQPLLATRPAVTIRQVAQNIWARPEASKDTGPSDLEAGIAKKPPQALFATSPTVTNHQASRGGTQNEIASTNDISKDPQQLIAVNPGCHQGVEGGVSDTIVESDRNSDQPKQNHVIDPPEGEAKTIKRKSQLQRKTTPTVSLGAKIKDCTDKYCPPHLPEMHKTILMASALVFLIFCGAGLLLVEMQRQVIEREAELNALDLARETGRWFSDALDNAMMPLFSLGQFVSQIEMFRKISSEMGPAGQEGSIPLREVAEGDVSTHRNLTNSSCTDPRVIARFDEIAGDLKSHANMEGVLLQLFMNPQAVVCRIHPLVVREDNFPPGVYYNATPSLGLDFMSNPRLVLHGLNTLRSDDLVIAGPLTLDQCVNKSGQCHPVVEKAFVARLPITVKGYSMEHGGEIINRWGFVAATINWLALVEQSGMYERFETLGDEFELIRIDRFFDNTTETVVLAESPRFHEVQGFATVRIPIKEARSNWEMEVKYNLSEMTRWRKWSIPIVIMVSFFIACLVYLILVQKVKAQKALVNTERNMTAYFAHELRNPLAAIDCALESMPEDTPETIREIHQGMRLCSGLMSSIMNNLLDVRTMEEGKLKLHNNPIDLHQLVTELYQMQLPAVRSGVKLSYKLETKGHKWVMGDKHRLQQVLTNVMSNAIKYTTSGTIVISVGWEVSSSKHLRWEKLPNKRHCNKRVRFEVADTGPGIPKDKQGELFQRFVRRSGAPGTGLGLAIAKHIVEVMDGTIHFESDPTVEQGAKCIALLPLEECPPADQEFMHDESVSNLSIAEPLIEEALTILIVDDVQMNRVMLKRRLQKCVAPKCVVTEASTGEEALALLDDIGMFDVIVVDQYMEGAGGVMVGTDCIIAMRRSGQTSSIIIGCSGNDMDLEFKEAGADFAWKKPLPTNAEIIRQFRGSTSCRRER